ncbi:MAG TPA: lipid-binding SYLF domain-containing protein [Xanthomonadaceae bacterium]|nr:lipid-binding SYLF domain-containing protein [Xanthomonadaceae bacterium]
MRRMSALCIAVLMFALPAIAGAREVQRAAEAVQVLREVMAMPESAIPENLLNRAYAIAVIPGVVKAGLVVGGRHGRGLIAVRGSDGTWTNPSFISITGGSVGFQAGVQATDIVLVFRTERGVDSIVSGKFTLGADAAVAAGPVGRTASASTDAQLRAEIYSYSRSRGLFAGVALDGAALAIDHRANQRVYGRNVTPRQIFAGGVRDVPGAVVDFRDALEEYTAR